MRRAKGTTAHPNTPQPSWRRGLILGALAIAALTLAAHAPAIGAQFIWDDDAYVTANPYLFDATGLWQIWFSIGATNMYAPVVFTTFWLEQHLWGLNPLGYHVVNIVLHAVAALLLWALLRRIRLPGAWLASAIFAVHPVMVESVAWVTELKNMQSTVFYILCLLAYFRFTPLRADDGAPARRAWRFYPLALVLFAAALMSKPAGVSLPIVILLLIWWRRARVERVDIAAVVPMLAMSAAAGLVTMHVDAYYLGGMGPAWAMAPIERVLVAGRALWFYVAKLAWPHPLMSIYPRWQASAGESWQYLYPIAAIAALAALWLARHRIGRGPFAATASFAILVAPTIGLTNFSYHPYSFVADRLVYQSAPVLIAALSASLATAWQHLGTRATARASAVPVAVVLLVLVIVSQRHARAFDSEKARCLDTLAKNPTAWVAMNNLGVALNDEGRPREAIRWYREAIRVRRVYPEAHNNLGVALGALGDLSGAAAEYREALRVWPDYAAAHNNLGTVLASTGDAAAAVRHYREALRIRPDYPEAHNNLAKLLASAGRAEEAIREHGEALRIRPNYADAHLDLGVTLASVGRFREAIAQYRQALALERPSLRTADRPNVDAAKAHANLAAALGSTGDVDGAMREYRQAVRLQPDYAEGYNGLAMALASTGRVQDAIEQFERALRLKPDYAEAHNNLGTALASKGDVEAAIRHYEAAVRLRPDYAEAHRNLGTALASGGDLQGAIREYTQALSAAPGDADAHNLLGISLADTGRLDEAIQHFEQALRLRPEDGRARENLEKARGLRRVRR